MKQKHTYCLFKTFLLFTHLIFCSTAFSLSPTIFPDLLSELDSITSNQDLFYINKKSPTRSSSLKKNGKNWTILVYMSADNDLRNFAIRNIKQMTLIGSTEYNNILVHLDIRISNNQKITRRGPISHTKKIFC